MRRSQADFVVAAEASDALDAAVGAASSVYDFCVQHPADARLLLAFSAPDLLAGPLTDSAMEGVGTTQRAGSRDDREPRWAGYTAARAAPMPTWS